MLLTHRQCTHWTLTALCWLLRHTCHDEAALYFYERRKIIYEEYTALHTIKK